MPRILYYAFPTGRVQGGIKMILRHVETLRDLGFDAVFSTTPQCQLPTWMDYAGPVLRNAPIQPHDVVVLPEDAENAIRQAGRRPQGSRTVIFCQNQLILGALGMAALDEVMAKHPVTLMAVGRLEAAFLRRAYPEAPVELAPCFADERRFHPQGERGPGVALMPKKRSAEAQVIAGYLRKFHPRHADRPWHRLTDATETEVARTLAASELYLSLSRFESVGMATLEAMASGCVCAGFTGIAGPEQEYATPDNGFWVPEDDCEAAADALAQAADLVLAGGPELARRRDAARATADAWSYVRFRAALEETWMRLAPDARVKNGPLD
jgi:hypothetical protein